MANMEKRIKLNCWHCKRNYTLLKRLNVDEQPKLLLECPFCEREGVVDLAPYRSDVVEVFKNIRDVTQDDGKVGQTLDLPETLPTTKPEE
jgi:hypothetical protein